MIKTHCDRCKEVCTNFAGRLDGSVTHRTQDGEQVGYDAMKPLDLCRVCWEAFRDFMKPAVVALRATESIGDDIVMARADVPMQLLP